MKKIILLLILILGGVFFFLKPDFKVKTQSGSDTQTSLPVTEIEGEEAPQMTIVAEGLDTPWALAFLPNNEILVTERAGRVRLIKDNQLQQEPVAIITQAQESGEGGLLGIAADPDFSRNSYVYLYYTYSSSGENTLNRVVRMSYRDNKLSEEKTIIDQIPGASNHNGGRIQFGPDKALYITTGDAGNPSLSQDTSSFAGKILRVEGEKTEVYSYGHRNPQGLAWDKSGKLWSTEHGRSGIQSGLDEVNLIEKGKNYGWPTIQGTETKSGLESPKLNSGNTTWAPADAAFFNNSLFFGGLRGQTLYEAVIDGNNITLKEHFKGQLGRIREVILGPDNMLYISTSNLDGRGSAKEGDDKVIKINPQKL